MTKTGGGEGNSSISSVPYPFSAFGLLAAHENVVSDRDALPLVLCDPLSNRTATISGSEEGAHPVGWVFYPKKDCANIDSKDGNPNNLIAFLKDAAKKAALAAHSGGKLKMNLPPTPQWTVQGTDSKSGLYVRSNGIADTDVTLPVIFRAASTEIPAECEIKTALPAVTSIPAPGGDLKRPLPGFSASISLEGATSNVTCRLLSVTPGDNLAAKSGFSFSLSTDLKEFTVTVTNHAGAGSTVVSQFPHQWMSEDSKIRDRELSTATLVQSTSNEGAVAFKLYFNGVCVLDTATSADFLAFNETSKDLTFLDRDSVFCDPSFLTFCGGVAARVSNLGYWRFALAADQVTRLHDNGFSQFASEFGTSRDITKENYVFSEGVSFKTIRFVSETKSSVSEVKFADVVAGSRYLVQSSEILRSLQQSSSSQYATAFAGSPHHETRFALAGQTVDVIRTDSSDNTIFTRSSDGREVWFTAECFAPLLTPVSGIAKFVSLHEGSKAVSCSSLETGTSMYLDRAVNSGKDLTKYMLELELGVTNLPSSTVPLVTFGTVSVLSLQANGLLEVFGKPSTGKISAGMLYGVKLGWNKSSGYGYLTLNNQVVSYFVNRRNGVMPSTIKFTSASIHRVALKPDLPSLIDISNVATTDDNETDFFASMGYQLSWAKEAKTAVDNSRSLAVEWIICRLDTLTKQYIEECWQCATKLSLSNLMSLGYPNAWCQEALASATLSDEEAKLFAQSPERLAALLLQRGLSYLLLNISRLTAAASSPVLVRPVISSALVDVDDKVEGKSSASFQLIPDSSTEAPMSEAPGSVDVSTSFYSEAMCTLASVQRDVDTPQYLPKPPRQSSQAEDKRDDEGKKVVKAFNAAKAKFESILAAFISSRLLTEKSLINAYSRAALVNLLKSNPNSSLLKTGFSWLVRVMEKSLPSGLDAMREQLIFSIVEEAPLLAATAAPSVSQGLVLDEKTPMIKQLIGEALYQLLVTCKLKAPDTENNVIQGGCPNPRLALFLLDLFAYVTGDLADTKSRVLAGQLRHLRSFFFCPVIVGLIFEAIPTCDPLFRLFFLKLLASLVVCNDKERRGGGSAVIHFDPQRFYAMKALMVRLQKKSSNTSNFLRALIELNVNIEDQIELEEKEFAQVKFEAKAEVKETSSSPDSTATTVHELKHSARVGGAMETFWPRCQYSSREDTNGVVYFIGSNCGTDSFKNPVKSENISVQVSVSRGDLKTENFVSFDSVDQSTYVEGTQASPPWFVINLGQWYVRPYCYRLKSTQNGDDYMRNWALQGRKDEGEWVILNDHSADESFKQPNEVNIWPLFMVTDTYNSFRVILTGPNSGNNFKLRAGGFEIYGQLMRAPTLEVSLPAAVAAPVAAESAPQVLVPKVANPQWFLDVHDALRMFKFFASGDAKTVPASYGALSGSLSRRCWSELAIMMSAWSSKNNDSAPDPSQISVDNLRPYPNLENAKQEAAVLKSAMEALAKFNSQIGAILGFINLNLAPNRSALTDGFRACCDLVFFNNKKARWAQALEATVGQQNVVEISVDPMKAATFQETGNVDEKNTELFWGQIFSRLKNEPSTMFRIPFGQRAFRVNYSGMRSIDAGGPYRDCIEHMCRDVQSKSCGLFLPCPNSTAGLGENRDVWIPNPSATSPNQLLQFEFLGKMMGLSLRTRNLLGFRFPSIVWKPLVGSPIDESDLESIDVLTVNILKQLNNQDAKNVNFDQNMHDMKFTVTGCDSRVIPLCPGGEGKSLTFQNRLEYAAMLKDFRLKEFKFQTAAIRRGLGKVVPLEALGSFSWKELETMVCGRGFASEDVDLLKRNTTYNSGSSSDQHIIWFWDILQNDFTDEQRALYLSFCWGRSRLPLTAAEFDTPHKLAGRSGGDSAFPMAHTCFFPNRFASLLLS